VETLLDFGRMDAAAQFASSGWTLRPSSRTVADSAGRSPPGYEVVLRSATTDAVKRIAKRWGGITNLDNAVKYSPEHRVIDVAVERANGRVAVSVRDRGVGIPKREQATVFEQFVRGSIARTAGIRGTGIGLTMVRHIVRAHNGEVSFTSAEGAGSTFTILLDRVASS
jgi:light-regulated signal transduction histidine kinase (bacteriophytochrome)